MCTPLLHNYTALYMYSVFDADRLDFGQLLCFIFKVHK